MIRIRVCTLALALALASCETSSPQAPPDIPEGSSGFVDAAVPDAYIGPAQAIFELPRDGMGPPSGFYALPFPNDIRINDATGAIELGDMRRTNELLGTYLDAIESQVRGFSVTAASFMLFDRPIAEDSLPQAPEDSLLPEASVYLVNVTVGSPRYGERVPLMFRFSPGRGQTIGPNWLAALPYPGFVLAERETYALVATTRVRATDGTQVTAAPELSAILSDAPSPDIDNAMVRARRIYSPLMVWLDEPGGDERGDVISAAVFTTQDATSLPRRMREVIHRDMPLPRIREVQRLEDREDFYWFDALFDGPGFQQGRPPFQLLSQGGNIAIDPDSDMPVIQRIDSLRVSFSVPRGQMPESGWPVVIYAHGTGGSYHSYARDIAGLLAKRGIAAISMDQVMHGPRIPNGGSPEFLFFNLQNPLAARDNNLQGAADMFQLTRLAASLRFTERRPGGVRVRFDPERIYFFGHSQGGITGPPFLAYEPLIRGAVLSGAGGLLYLSLTLKTQPVDVASLAQAFIRDRPFDHFNPVLALLQLYIDRSDPVVYGAKLMGERNPSWPPLHVYQSQGFTDRYTPLPSIEALATAMDLDPVQPLIAEIKGLSLRGRLPLAAPVTQNRGGATGVLVQYDEAPESDGHFVVFDVEAARVQAMEFLATLAQDGVATLVEP